MMSIDPMAAGVTVLHIVAAVLAGGAALFQWIAVHPTLAALSPEERKPIREAIVTRWRPYIFACIAVLLATGFMQFLMYKVPEYRTHPLKPVYHGLVGLKILTALAVFHFATVLALPGPKGERYRDNAGFWLKLLGIMLLVTIAIGGVLNSFPKA